MKGAYPSFSGEGSVQSNTPFPPAPVATARSLVRREAAGPSPSPAVDNTALTLKAGP
jgi:hypothetical protein